jgi:hypothetical protein
MLRLSTTTENCVPWSQSQVQEGISRFSSQRHTLNTPNEDQIDSDSAEEEEVELTSPRPSLRDQISSDRQALIAARAHRRSVKQLVIDYDQTLLTIQEHDDWVITQSPANELNVEPINT